MKEWLVIRRWSRVLGRWSLVVDCLVLGRFVLVVAKRDFRGFWNRWRPMTGDRRLVLEIFLGASPDFLLQILPCRN
jgi:hypothetical protein